MRTIQIISILTLCIVSSSAQAMLTNPLKRLAVRASARLFSTNSNQANVIAPWFRWDAAEETRKVSEYRRQCLVTLYAKLDDQTAQLDAASQERNILEAELIRERNNAFVCRTALVNRITDLEKTNARLSNRCQELFYDGSPETREEISNLKEVIADQSKQIKKLQQAADKSRLEQQLKDSERDWFNSLWR